MSDIFNEDFRSPAFMPDIAIRTEGIYRSVYLLLTLKRDKMLHERQQKEFDSFR